MLRWLIAVLVSSSLAAPASSRAAVRERDFLDILNAGHPALDVLGERAAAARAERVRAAAAANPVLGYERETPGSAEEERWSVAWTAPLDGRRAAALRAARAGERAASARLESDRLALRGALREAFAEWAIAAERADVAGRQLVLVQRLAEQMRARADRGEESALAARRVTFAAVELEAEAARSAAHAARARAVAYARHGSLPAGAEPERPALPDVAEAPTAPERADLVARRHDVERAEWRARLARRVLEFPELALGWRLDRDRGARDEGAHLAVRWALPLFDRRSAERIEADAALAAARAELVLARAGAEHELASARAAYARLRTAALHGMEAVGDGDRAVESALATFRLGESRLTDLLETLRSILAARLAALDLYAAALEAHRALELAAGRPLEGGE